MAETDSTAKKGTGRSAQKSGPSKSPPDDGNKKPGGKKKSASGEAPNYTKPELRQRLKDEIQAGDKGGRPGQWSARKAQLLAAEYEKHGGGYKKAARTSPQKHLEAWTEEKWRTTDGKKAVRGKTTARYLPAKAWEELTPAQRKTTDEKKKASSRSWKQFVANTPAAKRARKSASS